jgi:hypothetical protein
MRAYEFLTEAARGLLYRAQGDKFKNAQGQEIEFVSVTYVPSQPGAFQSKDELDNSLEQTKQAYPNLQYSNQPSARSRAYAILEFQDVNNPTIKLQFVRFFESIQHNMAGAMKNDALPGGWQLQKASSLKSSFKLKPTDIFPPSVPYKNVDAIISAAEQSGKLDKGLMDGLRMIKQKQLPTFIDYKEKEAAVRDDLGETIAPMCIIQGMITDGGITEAQEILLQNKPWSTCNISFPKGKNAGLIDSYLVPQVGTSIGISSKGSSGAKASVTNIFSGVKSLRERSASGDPAATATLKKYASIVKLLDDISNISMLDGPLVFGIQQGIITSDQSQLIKDAITNGYKSWEQAGLKPRSTNGKVLQSIADTVGAGRRKVDFENPLYNIGYHTLAGLARMVAENINKTKKFSEACLIFLNSSPLIQVHMYTKVQGNNVNVTGFETIYPPQFKGKLRLVADKSYYATNVGGKFSFAFD